MGLPAKIVPSPPDTAKVVKASIFTSYTRHQLKISLIGWLLIISCTSDIQLLVKFEYRRKHLKNQFPEFIQRQKLLTRKFQTFDPAFDDSLSEPMGSFKKFNWLTFHRTTRKPIPQQILKVN